MTTATKSTTLENWVAVYRGFNAVCAVVDRALMVDLDLSIAQFQALLFLKEASPCRNTDLAHNLVRQAQTLTGIIDRLEGKKYARRERHPKDRRAILVRLLPAGEKALEQAMPIVEAALPKAVERLNEGQRAMLIRLAASLEDNVCRRV